MVVDVSFRVTYAAPYTTLLKKRAWNEQVETPSWAAVGLFHKRHHLAKHFTAAGAAEYGYARRAAGYTAEKRRRFGHELPLVYTGALRAEVLSSREIRATAKGVKVILRASKANFRNPKGHAHPAAELRQVSEREAATVAKEKDREMARRIKRARGRQTKQL
jgi:hypothetical protein